MQLLFYELVAFLAGVITGLLGTGTGTVVGPLFLHMGMTPQVGLESVSEIGLMFVFFGVFLKAFGILQVLTRISNTPV